VGTGITRRRRSTPCPPGLEIAMNIQTFNLILERALGRA
jgi:hypothetical protein